MVCRIIKKGTPETPVSLFPVYRLQKVLHSVPLLPVQATQMLWAPHLPWVLWQHLWASHWTEVALEAQAPAQLDGAAPWRF